MRQLRRKMMASFRDINPGVEDILLHQTERPEGKCGIALRDLIYRYGFSKFYEVLEEEFSECSDRMGSFEASPFALFPTIGHPFTEDGGGFRRVLLTMYLLAAWRDGSVRPDVTKQGENSEFDVLISSRMVGGDHDSV